MLNEIAIKKRIESALHGFSPNTLLASAETLFAALGYVSDLKLEFAGDGKKDFLAQFNGNSLFRKEKACFNEWRQIRFVFQLATGQIAKQAEMFTQPSVNRAIEHSYLFFAVELSGDEYSRTDLTQITREINRLTLQPALILFSYGEKLSFAIIDRRLHKREDAKNVLEKVTLIKDISIRNPHRAHKEILFDLSLPVLAEEQPIESWEALHDAWKQKLNISELNKRFYRRIADWFYWAVENVKYPDMAAAADKRKNASIDVIRLLTRIIFVWFLKEKGLIPDALFETGTLAGILKKFDKGSKSDSNYYRAILQNLFFATLNQKMNSKKDHYREWVSEKREKGHNIDYAVDNKYRFPDLFKDPDDFLKLMSTVPYLNGGLFDCLDKKTERVYIDGFTRLKEYQPAVPNMLFFGEERPVDLSKVFDDAKMSREKVKGLIHILNDYKFTIAENTPIEEEVALDPELLGRVFENLLAAYNPETSTSARKATGSYYTPREIVNYMVDESLIAYLKTRMLSENPALELIGKGQTHVFGNDFLDGQLNIEAEVEPNLWKDKPDELERQLRILVAYTEEETSFNKAEKRDLITAIHSIKVLDPACGSGAFPMGMLLKLVHVLHKLDKDNAVWRELQERKASEEAKEVFQMDRKTARDERLREINEAFDKRINYPDYARKLFLIQNGIFGVDIQPVAVQISKLRFFISLLVDQKHNDEQENRGVLSLPNLETKFVAANTLIALEKRLQESMHDIDVQTLENELAAARSGIFSARSYVEKKRLQGEDKLLRDKLGKLIAQKALEAQRIIEKQIKALEEKNKANRKLMEGAVLLPARKKQYAEAVARVENEIALLSAKLLDKDIVEANAGRLAAWDPYNQNQSAEFFDLKWMFGIDDGFDVVIGNPPYVRQEEFKELKPLLQKQYECYTGTSDLYVYFYERGANLLRTNGILSYISSNKFFRAGYGEKLRAFLAEKTFIGILIDFGDLPVFDATTYPCVIVFRRAADKAQTGGHIVHARTMKTEEELRSFDEIIRKDYLSICQKDLKPEGWRLEDERVLRLLEKIKKAGVPLEEYVKGKIFYGIKTGFNEAFVIDEATKKKLLKEDKRSVEVIKPLLRGRDIKRYGGDKSGLFLLFIPWHFPLHENPDISGVSKEAEIRFKSDYPAIYKHLFQFKTELLSRNKDETGIRYEWYALQRCAASYWEEFGNNKIIWGNLGTVAGFAFDLDKQFISAPACLISTTDYYLLALLNSKLGDYFFHQIAAIRQGGFLEYKPMYVSQLPVLEPTTLQRRKIEAGVDKILSAKKDDSRADTSGIEEEIDGIVYEIYGLTGEEIGVVEGKI